MIQCHRALPSRRSPTTRVSPWPSGWPQHSILFPLAACLLTPSQVMLGFLLHLPIVLHPSLPSLSLSLSLSLSVSVSLFVSVSLSLSLAPPFSINQPTCSVYRNLFVMSFQAYLVISVKEIINFNPNHASHDSCDDLLKPEILVDWLIQTYILY